MSVTYLTATQINKKYGIGRTTLLNWEKKGEVNVVKTKGGHRRYEVQSLFQTSSSPIKRKFAYTRVSSSKQKRDLQRQQEFIRRKYPSHELISDIGSGINFKRKGFCKMVEQIMRGNVEEIVVSHKDRLCRFAFDFFEFLCEKHGTKLVVENHEVQSSEQELAEDLLSIIHIFSCRRYGLRRYEKIERPI